MTSLDVIAVLLLASVVVYRVSELVGLWKQRDRG